MKVQIWRFLRLNCLKVEHKIRFFIYLYKVVKYLIIEKIKDAKIQ